MTSSGQTLRRQSERSTRRQTARLLFPKIKGTVTALVMIASSLCNYIILTAASKMQPSQVMVMNIVLTAIGVVLGLFVNLRYTKTVELSKED